MRMCNECARGSSSAYGVRSAKTSYARASASRECGMPVLKAAGVQIGTQEQEARNGNEQRNVMREAQASARVEATARPQRRGVRAAEQ